MTFTANHTFQGQPVMVVGISCPDNIDDRLTYVFQDGREYCPPCYCNGVNYMAYWPVAEAY